MADQSEVYEYILRVENEEKVKQAAAAAALAEQKFKAFYATLGAGHAQTQAAASRLVDLNKQLGAAGGSGRDFGRAALEASRGLEDLQYGVAGVLNNLPGLVAALGGPAGLAAIVSGVAVTGKILYDHWDDLAGLFGQPTTKTEAERMEELGKKTAKTAEETFKLLTYEQQRKNLEAQRGPTAAATEAEQRINEAIREAPELNVRHAVEAIHGPAVENAISQTLLDELAAARNTMAASQRRGSEIQPEYARERLRAAEEAINTARVEMFNKIQADLVKNPAALAAFTKEAAGRGLLPKDVAERIGRAGEDPEAEKERLAGIKAEQEINNEKARLLAALKEVVSGVKDTSLMSELERELDAARESARSMEEGVKAEQKIAAEKARLLAAIEEVTTGQRNLAGMSDLEQKLESEKLRVREVEQRATSGTAFGQRAEFAAVRGLLAGGSRSQVTTALGVQMARELRAQGVAPQRAFEMARDQSRQVVGRALDDALTGGPGRPAQRIGMGEFARSVESAGMVKMTDLTTQMKDSLAQIVTNTRTIGRAGP